MLYRWCTFLLMFLQFPLIAQPKIVVVGGGLAGLVTAYRLNEQGYAVELYEARNRLGGRVFSVMTNGQVAELGAQNIYDGEDSDHIEKIINELHLKKESRDIPFNLHYFDEDNITNVSFRLKKNKFTPQLTETLIQNASEKANNMLDILSTIFGEDHILITTFNMMLAAYVGLPADQLGVNEYSLKTFYHLLLGGLNAAQPGINKDRVYLKYTWIRGGNYQLPYKLASKLPFVKLNSPLIAITMTADERYLLSFKTGEQVESDILVLAIPCKVYEDICIDDAVIPETRLKTIISEPYGKHARIVIPTLPAIEDVGQFVNDRAVTYYQRTLSIMNLYYIGEPAKFSSQSIQNHLSKDKSILEMFYNFPDDMPAVVTAKDEPFATYDGPVGHSWPNDPYVKGSFSVIKLEAPFDYHKLENYGDEVVRPSFIPVNDRLFFAGEHASILLNSPATMEAAIESGERTARLIQKSIKNQL